MSTLVNKFNELVEFVQPVETDIEKGESLAQYLTRVMNTVLKQLDATRKEGTPRLASFPYVVSTSFTGQTDFEIPLTTFNPDTDTILVFRNRTALTTDDYTILPTRTKFKIVLMEAVLNPKDTTIFMIVLKNVPVGEDGPIDASLTLKSGTVTADKLDPKYKTEITTKIENKADGSFATDLSNTVTDLIGILGVKPEQMSLMGLQSVVKLYAYRVIKEQTFAVENVPEQFRDRVIVMVDVLKKE